MKKLPWWVLASCIASLILSLFPLSERIKAESANRALGLSVEFSTVLDMATASGITERQALERLKSVGVNGLILSEETVAELQGNGRLNLRCDAMECMVTGSPDLLNRIQTLGLVRFPSSSFLQADPGTVPSIRFIGSPEELRTLSLGIDPGAAILARNLGLEILVRHSNVLGAGPNYVRAMLKNSSSHGARWFLPSGDQMLGRRSRQKEVAEALKGLSMFYVTPEFVKLSGDDVVRNAIPDRTVRLHSIQAAEIDKMTLNAVEERYVKAYRERGIRWLLMRPYSQGEADPLTLFEELIGRVKKGAEKEGAVIKVPRPFDDPTAPSYQFVLMYLAALPLLCWAAAQFFQKDKAGFIALAPLGLIALATFSESFRPYAALVAAIGFPTAAYLWLDEEGAPQPIVALGLMVFFSLTGGIMVSSSLIGVEWMIQNDQFSGIKIAHFLPIGLAGFILLRRQVSFKKLFSEPILWGTAFLGVVLLVGVAFMLARTGNDSPASVSGLELQFRSLLDRVLYTRPRTKEFLIGHPALIIGLFLMYWSTEKPSLKPIGAILVTLGAIGLTSIVNTMCHLHSPVELSLARIAIGLVIGGILGLVGAAGLKAFKFDQTKGKG